MYKYLIDLLRGNKDRLSRADREEIADALIAAIAAGRYTKLSRERIQQLASKWWDAEWADWMEGFARDIENEVRGGR